MTVVGDCVDSGFFAFIPASVKGFPKTVPGGHETS